MREFEDSEKDIKKLMSEFFSAPHIKEQYLSGRVAAHWEQIAGHYIASKTADVKIKNKTLILKLISAPLRQELAYNKEKVIALVNEDLGEDLVTDIKLL